jgi:hypothetical protein
MTRWEKLRQLTRAEFLTLLSAFLLLPLIHLLLGMLGYARLLRLIQTLTPIREKTSMTAPAMHGAKSMARMVAIAAGRGLYRATCLRKSLLVLYLLRRMGVPAQLRFGVRLENARLEAHAWVEWQGEVVNDAADVRQRYVPLESGFPQTQAGL